MASETVTSAIDEQIVNKEKSGAIADLITSLANEDEVKHDKPEDPNGGHTTPSSKPEDETKIDLGAVEVQKSHDSPALEASAEDNLTQTPAAAPLSKTEDDTTKPEFAVVENTYDLVSLDAHVEDNLKGGKEVIQDSNDTDNAGKSQPNEPSSTEPAQHLEKESVEVEEEKQPETVAIPEASDETIEKSNNIAEDIPQTESEAELVKEEKTRELSADILKEANDSEPVPKETVKAELVVTEVEENLEKTEEKQSNTGAISGVPSIEPEILKETNNYEEEPAKAEKAVSETTIEVVKDSDTSELEVVSAIEEKTEHVSTEVEEKPRKLVQVAENVGETSIDETSDDTIKDPIPLKEEKPDNEKETSIIANSEHVSDPENLVESSLEVTEKFPEVDGKKESGFTDVTKEVSKDEAAILEVPEPQTGLKEEREYVVPEENVAENDYKKEQESPESVNEGQTEAAKVDEISSAVSEPVRETLASKFEQESTKTGVENFEKEQAEEPAKTDTQVPEDVAKTSSKDLREEPATKPAQKQSNNIISKVKQSLVKAKKAIIGKSPSSKNHSTESKDDIPVK